MVCNANHLLSSRSFSVHNKRYCLSISQMFDEYCIPSVRCGLITQAMQASGICASITSPSHAFANICQTSGLANIYLNYLDVLTVLTNCSNIQSRMDLSRLITVDTRCFVLHCVHAMQIIFNTKVNITRHANEWLIFIQNAIISVVSAASTQRIVRLNVNF